MGNVINLNSFSCALRADYAFTTWNGALRVFLRFTIQIYHKFMHLRFIICTSFCVYAKCTCTCMHVRLYQICLPVCKRLADFMRINGTYTQTLCVLLRKTALWIRVVHMNLTFIMYTYVFTYTYNWKHNSSCSQDRIRSAGRQVLYNTITHFVHFITYWVVLSNPSTFFQLISTVTLGEIFLY